MIAPTSISSIWSFISKSMASLLHAFLQLPHLPFVSIMQMSLSMVITLGTACIMGM